MCALKVTLIFFGVCAVSASAIRVIRSPSKMEVDIPNQSIDRDSGEYQENMNQEAAYWQGQGDKVGQKEEEGHDQLEEDRDRNQENYNYEKEHYGNEQQNLNKEMNETYQDDRDKADAHNESNQEHYNNYNQNVTTPDFNFDNPEDLTETETGDRYGEKGTDYMDKAEDRVDNHDVNGDVPSITYTRS